MASAANTATGLLASTRKLIDALLGDVGGLLADLTSQEQPTDASEDEDSEQARRVIDVELQRFWQSYYELKRRHDENALSVAVLALTKSGKSTLLNSLMGMEVLPMNNVPETARICRIVHDPASREPQLRDGSGKTPVRGEAAVRSRLQELNNAARTHRSGSASLLSPQSSSGLGDEHGGAGGSAAAASGGIGGPTASSLLHISAPLMALDGFGPEFGRVTLLDTPGPNEAGEEQLKYQVERLLEGVDCVLYLLDYTKLKTAEEEGLFRRLRAINPQLVARLSSRLFFVINKVDACETSEGLDPDEVRNYVADLVTRQLGGAPAPATAAQQQGPPGPASPPSAGSHAAGSTPGSPASSRDSGSAGGRNGSGFVGPAAPPPPPFRLHPDQVLLLSARNALLARLVLSGRAGPDASKRFQRLAFGSFGAGMMMMGGGRGGAAAGPSPEQVRAAAGCLLEGSGILELEGRVLTFLAAHAGSVKLLATADDTARLLAQVRNVALTCRSCLHRNVAVLQAQAEELRAELAEAAAAFEEVRLRTDSVQAEVVAEIKAHLNTLRRRLFTHIVQTLDTDARAPPPTGGAGGSSSTSSGPLPGNGSPFSRWARVREKFLSMFTAASSSSLPPQSGAAGPSLVSEARSRSREELQSLLLELHDDLMGQIHSEVYDFWGVLEACAASRHSELLSALNGHLAALSRRVEGAVSEALGVQLAPADIRLRPPSSEQLHSDVQELIEKGIRESTEKHIRVGTRTTTERVLRQPSGPPSLCRWGGYWVDVPRTRTVVETYTATVYSLRPEEIANHFIGLVDSAVSASEQALSSYVGAMVERQLAAARQRLTEYGDRYLDAMTAALSASSRGAEHRSAALAAVEGYLARLEELLGRAQQAQREAEAAVPGGAAGLMDEVEVFDDEDEEEEEERKLEQAEGGGSELAGSEQLGQKPQQVAAADEEDGEERQEEEEQDGGAAVGAPDFGQAVEAWEEESQVRQSLFEALAATVLEEVQRPHQEVPAGGTLVAALPAEEAPKAAGQEAETGAAAGEPAQLSNAAAVEAAAVDLLSDTEVPSLEDFLTVDAADAEAPAAANNSAGDIAPDVSSGTLAAATTGAAVADDPGTASFGSDGGLTGKGSTMEAEVEADRTDCSSGQCAAEAAQVPSLQHLAGAALESGALPGEAAAGATRVDGLRAPAPAPVQQPEVGAGEQPGLAAESSAVRRSGTSVSQYGASSGLGSYSGPFDYGRAFLEAMSSSEMAIAAEGTLTMIPLSAEGPGQAQGPGSACGGGEAPGSPAAGRGSETPRSGASEDWQLVGMAGEEGMEELEKAAAEQSKEMGV